MYSISIACNYFFVSLNIICNIDYSFKSTSICLKNYNTSIKIQTMKKFLLLFFYIVGITISVKSQSFKFALITDTHIGSPNNDEDLLRTVNDINSFTDIDFAIISGDVTEFGSYNELRTAKSLLDNLKIPYYIIPGNHDSNWSESGTNDFLRKIGRASCRERV